MGEKIHFVEHDGAKTTFCHQSRSKMELRCVSTRYAEQLMKQEPDVLCKTCVNNYQKSKVGPQTAQEENLGEGHSCFGFDLYDFGSDCTNGPKKRFAIIPTVWSTSPRDFKRRHPTRMAALEYARSHISKLRWIIDEKIHAERKRCSSSSSPE
jgi:hypothetical protein